MDAERFVSLWAGWETGNPSEAEAMAKGRAMRRMADADGLRIIDALELPEVRKAIDDKLQPARQAMPDAAALKAENDELRGKLSEAVPKLRNVTEELTARMQELQGAQQAIAEQRDINVRWSAAYQELQNSVGDVQKLREELEDEKATVVTVLVVSFFVGALTMGLAAKDRDWFLVAYTAVNLGLNAWFLHCERKDK
jgi:hypothetical protein